MNERQNTLIEEVMKEAQRTQKQLEDKSGLVLREPVMFDATDEAIAKAGEISDRTHLNALNNAVEARLNEVKAEVEEELSREQDRINAQIDRLRHQSDQEIDALSTSSTQELKELSDQIQTQRQELLGIQPMQF